MQECVRMYKDVQSGVRVSVKLCEGVLWSE